MPHVDVLLSPEELVAMSKKQNAAVQCISPAELRLHEIGPFYTYTSYVRLQSRRQSKHHPTGRARDIAHYAELFQRYNGSSSFIDQLVADNRAERAAEIDAEIEKRAVRETRAKYLNARLAGMYQVEVPGVIGPPPASAPLLGLAMVHATGTAHGNYHQPDTNSQKVLDMAQQLANVRAAQEAAAEAEAARSAQEARHKAATRVARTQSASAAFRSTTREQARCTGSKFADTATVAPGPGKYDLNRCTWASARLPRSVLDPPKYGQEIKALLAKRAEEKDLREGRGPASTARALQSEMSKLSRVSRASAGTGVTGVTGMTGVTAAFGAGPSRSRAVSMAGSVKTELAAERALKACASSKSVGTKTARPATAPAGGKAGAHVIAPLSAGVEVFRDAHHVHPRPASALGTSSFKATSRPAAKRETAAHHLACKYHKDDIDSTQIKPPHLVLPFSRQVPRPSPTNICETPEVLGPGFYLGSHNMPATMTGRHVPAGHVVMHGPDMSRQSPRPASAMQQLTTPIPPVSNPEAAKALQELFGEQLNASDLVSIVQLQDLSGVDAKYDVRVMKGGGGGHSRPLSAMACAQHSASIIQQHARPFSAIVMDSIKSPGSEQQHHHHQQQQQQQQQESATSGDDGSQEVVSAGQLVAQHTEGQALSQLAPASKGPQQSGPQWLSQEELQKYSSTGMKGPVPGGSFTRTTRAQEIKTLRVVADGKVIPPACAVLTKGQASDVFYEQVGELVQGHHQRSPAWQLPPNRAALSKQWVSAAALAYL